MTSCIILIIAELVIYIIYRIIKSHFKKKQRNQGIPYEYYNEEEPLEESNESEIPKKTATREENLEWFETNFSKLVTNHQGKWIVISNREIVKIGDDGWEMKKFRDSYSKLDINCISVHCIDLNLYYNNTTDVEKSSCSIGAANY